MEVLTIFGPPGTGKTRTLVEFAAKEDKAVFLSYTRAAAAEAVSRLENKDSMQVSTLHSLAYAAAGLNHGSVVDVHKLREFSRHTGIPFKGADLGVEEAQEGDEYLAALSYARNAIMDVTAAYAHFGAPGTLERYRMCVAAYGEWKREYGYADFDDMLSLLVERGPARHPAVVFLDEAQDCTPLQWQAFGRVVEKARRVYVAGDDDQAIYEWNGANPHGMVKFMNDNKGELFVLAQSHRLPHAVWHEATKLIGTVRNRVDKTFHPTHDRGEVVRWGWWGVALDQLQRVAPDGALILARDRFKMEEIRRALNRDLIPYDCYNGSSPWTGRIARELREGKNPEISPAWQLFFNQAKDRLNDPVKYHLSTIHGAKGREHDTVIVDLDLPGRVLHNLELDRDAEVRVQYVAITRARKALHLCGENPLL